MDIEADFSLTMRTNNPSRFIHQASVRDALISNSKGCVRNPKSMRQRSVWPMEVFVKV